MFEIDNQCSESDIVMRVPFALASGQITGRPQLTVEIGLHRKTLSAWPMSETAILRKLQTNGLPELLMIDSRARTGLSQLEHGMVILFVGELTGKLPTLVKVELHRNRIRPNDTKAARSVTTGSDLSFALRQ